MRNNPQKEIIELIKEGISLNKISKKLNIPKSSIYYYYKKIKGRKFPKPIIPNDDKILGEFLGIFAGDGSFFYDKKRYNYTISIGLHAIDDRAYGNYIKSLIEKNFNKKVREYTKDNALTLVFYSKDIFKLIDKYLNLLPKKTYNIYIKKSFNSLSNDFLRLFVRGIVDTDGHHKKDGRIVLCLVSKRMIQQVSSILKSLSINNKVYIKNKKLPKRKQYELTIPKREVEKYIKIIGFSNKRKESINAVAGIRTPVETCLLN